MLHRTSPARAQLAVSSRSPVRAWLASLAMLLITMLVLIAPGCLSTSNSATPTPSGSVGLQTSTASSSTGSATQSTSGAGPPSPAATANGSTATTPATAPAATATTVDLSSVNISLEPIFGGLNRPLYLTDSGDGSGDIFILEKAGRIMLVRDGKVQDQPFLDIQSRVGSSGSEQGLLGLAFHPDYKSNGYLFVDYTDTNGDTVIARFTAAPDRNSADPNSFKMILGFQQPFSNHNGGQIAFGPDGMLWIGAGDGGSAGDPRGNGQNPNTLLGSILRIDVDHGDPYAIPPDNPFADGSGGRPEVWAYGLRNPWRFSFDRQTHDLYIGDVGQNSWEEVDFVPSDLQPGLNFGWNRMEGTHCFRTGSDCDKSGLTLPVAEYPNPTDGCAVTGGYVYRGAQFPAIDGVYFFSDYCSGTIWALTHDASGNWTQTEVAQGSAGFSSFGEDGTGELYVTDLSNGVVYHLVASSK